MKILKKHDAIVFDNDEDFFKFAVDTILVIDNNGGFDWNFTEAYNDCITKGTNFIIKGESQIFKRGRVSYRTVAKRVDNMLPDYMLWIWEVEDRNKPND